MTSLAQASHPHQTHNGMLIKVNALSFVRIIHSIAPPGLVDKKLFSAKTLLEAPVGRF